MARKTVAAVIKLIDQFSSPSKQVITQSKNIEKRFREMGRKVEAVGSVFESIGSTMTKAITMPAIAAGTASVKFADDSKQAMDQFFSATGIAADGMDGFIKNSEKYQKIMNNIYKDNFGESINDVAEGMAKVKQNMSYLDDSALKSVTEYAFTLADTFGVDIAESTRAADALIKNYGVSAKEAFNLMSQGAQSGLDFSGELFDNLDEYSVQFQKLGFSADDMFNIFAAGAKNGAFNLDKIGDAVKEFSIRAIDGSDTTAAGFEAIGFDAKKMAEKFAAGGDSAREAFDQVIQGLASMKDPIAQNTAGVNLFGTMWEDLGVNVVTSLSTVNGAIDKSKESMEALVDTKYDNLSSALSAFGRTLQTDVLQPVGERLIPYVEMGIEKLHLFTDWWNELGEAGQGNVIKIVGVAAMVGPALLGVGKIATTIVGAVTNFGKLAGAVTRAGGAVKVLGTVMKFSLVGVGVAAVVALGVAIYKNWDTIKEWAGNVKGKFVEFKNSAADAFDNAKAKVISFKDSAVDKLNSFGDKLIELKNGAVENFKTGVNTALDLVAEHFPGFYDSVSGVLDNAKTAFNGMTDFVSGVFTGNWEKAWNGVMTAFSGIFGGIGNYAKAPLNGLIDLVNKAIGAINKVSVSIPNWVPGVGGNTLGFSIPTIPNLYKGTDNWQGGLAVINEPQYGGEIVELPSGSKVYPHDESVKKAREEGGKNRSITITIAKIADSIIIRNEDDINRIAAELAKELEAAALNMA